MPKKPGFMLYNEWEQPLMSLPAPALKKFLQGMFHYNNTGEEPQFKNPVLQPLWEIMRSRLDYDTRRYERVTEQHRTAANARWERERRNRGEADSQRRDNLDKYM